MWVQGVSTAVAWRGLTAEADGLWATLARSSAQRQRQLRQVQRTMRGVDVGELAGALACPAVFANTHAADTYHVQINQVFERAQQQIAQLEQQLRACVSHLQLSDCRFPLPRMTGPDFSAQPALLTVYVARYHAYLQQYQAALGQAETLKPIHQAWLQWAAVAAIIDVVANWVNVAAPLNQRPRFTPTGLLSTLCPPPTVQAAPLRSVCLNPLLC